MAAQVLPDSRTFILTDMKRVFIFLSLLLYMIVSMGMVVQRHYCMGRFYAATILPRSQSACSRCGMAKGQAHHTGCCDSESKFVRLQLDQQASDQIVKGFQSGSFTLPAPLLPKPDLLLFSKQSLPISRTDPPRRQSPIFILDRAFLI